MIQFPEVYIGTVFGIRLLMSLILWLQYDVFIGKQKGIVCFKSSKKTPNKFALSKNWECFVHIACFQKKKTFQFCLRISNKLLNAHLFILSAKLINSLQRRKLPHSKLEECNRILEKCIFCSKEGQVWYEDE